LWILSQNVADLDRALTSAAVGNDFDSKIAGQLLSTPMTPVRAADRANRDGGLWQKEAR
jgi:hypothetical protein